MQVLGSSENGDLPCFKHGWMHRQMCKKCPSESFAGQLLNLEYWGLSSTSQCFLQLKSQTKHPTLVP